MNKNSISTTRKQHVEDVKKAKEAHKGKEVDLAKAKRKRKQMQLALAVEIELQMAGGQSKPKAAEQPKHTNEKKTIQMGHRIPDWEHDGDTD